MYISKNPMFRDLSSEEEENFKEWARDNYVYFSEIKSIWHPVIQEECKKLNKAEAEANEPNLY